MVKRNYRIKKTISMKQFISELGEGFSEHMKNRLMDLEVRCVLTRKDELYRFDIKHVEHTLYDCSNSDDADTCKKEYAFGQLVVLENLLYFSEACIEAPGVMQSSVVKEIYDSLSSENIIVDSGISSKRVDDSNVDYVIDSILKVCPEVSEGYLKILKEMFALRRN